MNLFQILALAGVLAILAWELVRAQQGHGRQIRFIRLAVWTATGIAIMRPDLVQVGARILGIGRGTDVVLYLFVLCYIATSLFLYSKYLGLRRDLTEVVRQQAIERATRGRGLDVFEPRGDESAERSDGPEVSVR